MSGCHRVPYRGALRAAAAAALSMVAGCGLLGGPTSFRQDTPQQMTVTSPVIDQGAIPRRYICRGGQSPPLYWSGEPQGTKSLAIVVDDSDAPITPYVYWLVFNVSPSRADIQGGQLPAGAREAMNSLGEASYDPPCPDASHAYRFTVYALNSVLRLPSGAGLKQAWTAIAQHAIARGRLTAVARQ